MKKINGFIGQLERVTMSLEDAFIDYLNDNYFPGAVDDLDTDTVDFEYNNFLNAYEK
jgi:hypothetical protein